MKPAILLATFLCCSVVSVAFAIKANLQTNEVISKAADKNGATTSMESFARDVIVGLGPSGFMCWICYYMIAKAIPAKDAMIECQRKDHLAEMKEERAANKAAIDSILEELRDERKMSREIIEHCPGVQDA